MNQASLKDISGKMRHLDFCMMTTTAEGEELASRPMSNNGDVEYDGNSYFFSSDRQSLVQEIEKNAQVNLSFVGDKKLFISVVGEAEVIRDREAFKQHWRKGLDEWFKEGVDTPGLVLIRVKGKNLKFWQNMDSGEVNLQ
ncbi:pyridoxamine 5'-phosphate oxidase family protein [soil metagenome]